MPQLDPQRNPFNGESNQIGRVPAGLEKWLHITGEWSPGKDPKPCVGPAGDGRSSDSFYAPQYNRWSAIFQWTWTDGKGQQSSGWQQYSGTPYKIRGEGIDGSTVHVVMNDENKLYRDNRLCSPPMSADLKDQ